LELYRQLPQNFLEFGIGIIFCFFGGVYPTLFAAVQAAENGGRTAVLDALYDLAQEATIIVEESKKDDTADEDKDGKKDVVEITNKEYYQRKTLLVLRKMNPEKVSHIQGVITMIIMMKLSFYCQSATPVSLLTNWIDSVGRPTLGRLTRQSTPFIEFGWPLQPF
jgi:hypothetical protein